MAFESPPLALISIAYVYGSRRGKGAEGCTISCSCQPGLAAILLDLLVNYHAVSSQWIVVCTYIIQYGIGPDWMAMEHDLLAVLGNRPTLERPVDTFSLFCQSS